MKQIILTLLTATLAVSVAQAGVQATVNFQTLPWDYQNGSYNGGVGTSVFFPSTSGTMSVTMYCDDYADDTYVPSTSSYTLSYIGSGDQMKFGTANAPIYQEAALLMAGDGNSLGGLNNETDQNLVTLYQYALWDLFEPASATFSYNGLSSTAIDQIAMNDVTANAGAYQTQYSSILVFSPNAGNPGQEFLAVDALGGGEDFPDFFTPEPATWAMLACGLALMGLKFAGRFRRSA